MSDFNSTNNFKWRDEESQNITFYICNSIWQFQDNTSVETIIFLCTPHLYPLVTCFPLSSFLLNRSLLKPPRESTVPDNCPLISGPIPPCITMMYGVWQLSGAGRAQMKRADQKQSALGALKVPRMHTGRCYLSTCKLTPRLTCSLSVFLSPGLTTASSEQCWLRMVFCFFPLLSRVDCQIVTFTRDFWFAVKIKIYWRPEQQILCVEAELRIVWSQLLLILM